MNFKTTIVLLVLLLGIGAYVFFTNEKPADTTAKKDQVHTLLDVKSGDVTGVALSGADAKPFAVRKSDGDKWQLTQPMNAPADSYKVSSLVDQIISLKSTSVVPGTEASKTGLDHPQYIVQLHTTAGKDVKLDVGNRLSVSDGVYVRVDGHDTIDVVSASLLDALAKPASDLRKTQMFDTASSDIKQITIARRDGSTVSLAKNGETWKIITPAAMPADSSAVDGLVYGITGMQAVEFVDDPRDAIGLQKPALTVTFSTAAPSTQPATAPTTLPEGMTIKFGGYDDLDKKNVFAAMPDGSVVKVAASTFDSFNKKPLDLRDKKLATLDIGQVSQLTLVSRSGGSTKPVVAPTIKTISIALRPKVAIPLGPPLPVTRPATMPTTGPAIMTATAPTTLPATQSATKPAPPTKWMVLGKPPGDADDLAVDKLLGDVAGLTATKFIETPSTQPVIGNKYVLTFTTIGPGGTPVVEHRLTINDPGNEQPVTGSCEGLNFEADRAIVADLQASLAKK